jgi:hypothetical protein
MLSGFSTRSRARLSLRFLNPPLTSRRRAESGYALVMAMFLIVAMLVSSQVVLRNLVTLRRRQREADTIWRGQQYVRAIRLYYHKTGHYPQSLDDLEKGLPELHFLRFCAYKDPINSAADGSWRFIYVNGTGAIIGSVRYANLQQMALIDLNGGKLPGSQPGTPAADLASASGSDDANATANTGANSGSQASQPQQGQAAAPQPSASSPFSSPFGTAGAPSGAAGATSIGTGLNGAPGQDLATNPLLLLKPTGPVDGPVLGAFITGVASKVDASSLRVYKGGKKYIDWEFIWNPLEDQARAVQSGLSQVQGSQQPGQFGLPIGSVNGAAPGQPEGGPAAPQQAQPQGSPPASNPD